MAKQKLFHKNLHRDAILVAITLKVLPRKEEEFKAALCRSLEESFIRGDVEGAGLITSFPSTNGCESGLAGLLQTKRRVMLL